MLLTTGGTIASLVANNGRSYRPELAGAALLEGLPTESDVRIEIVEFSMKPSYMLTMIEIVDLVTVVRDQTQCEDVVGVVITMGTAAMEEIAYLLDLLVDGPCPIVLTGAMLHASHPGYDGMRNIGDAVRVAVHPESPDRGTLVCMAGEVHAAREVQKLHRTSLTSFVSWPNGPVALADVDRVVWLRRARGRRSFGDVSPEGPVDLVKATLGCDGRQVRSAIAVGVRGMVIEGFPGAGGVTADLFQAVTEALALGIPILTTSRSPFGRVVPTASGGAGPRDLVEAGSISCGDLPAAKARLLLMCALAVTHDCDELRAIVSEIAP